MLIATVMSLPLCDLLSGNGSCGQRDFSVSASLWQDGPNTFDYLPSRKDGKNEASSGFH